MKKILTIAVACAGLMCFSSCNDFLEENPRSTLTNVGFYQTQSQMEANTNYLYRNGATRAYSDYGSAYINTFQAIQEELTGYFSNSYERQEPVTQYTRLLTRQQNTMRLASKMDDVWRNAYLGINVANGVIKYAPTVQMDGGVADRLIAEAKFFRAFDYFWLVKTFGAVPFYTEPYEAAENMELPRTETATIYAQIESDLKDAMNVLADATFAANSHRITKHIAAMTLTDVYMYQGKYAEAAETVRTVINSGHSLTTNDDMGANSAYNKLRTTDDLNEVIYAYEFNAEISDSGWLPTYAFDATATSMFTTYSITERTHGANARFLNIYTDNDLRGQNQQFFVWSYTNPITGTTWSSEEAGSWYFFEENAMLETGKGSKDWNIYRYAEALLDAAESIAQANGVTAEAAGYLAQIKARASMDGRSASEIAAELQGMGKQQFIEECWNERLREMPLEYKMWDLCVRTKKFPYVSETTKGQITWVDLVGATNASGATIKESDLLWPISTDEIQRNPSLTQNPGY